MTDEELVTLKTLLQRSEYDALDIMDAWLAVEELIEIKRALRELAGRIK